MALSKGPYLFCEGIEGGLDKILLGRLVGVAPIQVKPIGSKYGLSHRIEGYLQGAGDANASTAAYIALRDRDFDFTIPEKCALIVEREKQDSSRQWVLATYRACVESYFIDAGLIAGYWQYLYEGLKNQPPAPEPESVIHNKILDAARQIADYQAVRWALADLKPRTPPFTPRLRSSWKKDGDLPVDLGFEACLQQAQQQFTEEYKKHPVISLSWDQVEQAAEGYRSRFQMPAFFDAGEYLVWFHGKDLMKQVFRVLTVPHLGQTGYEKWAAKNVDFARFDDLLELSERCTRLTT